MTTQEFWNRYLRIYDALNMSDGYRAYVDDIAARLCTRPGQRVLDAGSGTGNLSIKMKNLSAQVVSLDFSPVALAIHKEKDPSAVQTRASLEMPLPFEDGIFDAVACTSVLFALSPTGVQTALREFKRVLRPKGRLLITASKKGFSLIRFTVGHFRTRLRTLPFRGWIREMWHVLLPMLRILYYAVRVKGFKKQGRYRRFVKEELLSLIADAGFTQLRCRSTFGGWFNVVEAVAASSSNSSVQQGRRNATEKISPVVAVKVAEETTKAWAE